MKKIELPWICRRTIVALLALSPVSSVLGKIADPSPLIKDNVRYQSHRHSVWATNVLTNKVLWKTKIAMAEDREDVDPRLEGDVRWNMISSLQIEGNILVITNSIGEKFNLDSLTGNRIGVKKGNGELHRPPPVEGYHARLMGMLTGVKKMPINVRERLLSLNQDDPLVGVMGVHLGMSMDEVIDVWGMPNVLEVINIRAGLDDKIKKEMHLGIYISDFTFQDNKLIRVKIHLADFKTWKPFGGRLDPQSKDVDLLKVFKDARQLSKTNKNQEVELRDGIRVRIHSYQDKVITVALEQADHVK